MGGVVGMLDKGSISQWLLNVMCIVVYMVVIAYRRPSKDERCNRANVFMHFIFLSFAIVSLLLNPRLNIAGGILGDSVDGGASMRSLLNIVTVVLLGLQVLLLLY